jgi:hypothetical protein
MTGSLAQTLHASNRTEFDLALPLLERPLLGLDKRLLGVRCRSTEMVLNLLHHNHPHLPPHDCVCLWRCLLGLSQRPFVPCWLLSVPRRTFQSVLCNVASCFIHFSSALLGRSPMLLLVNTSESKLCTSKQEKRTRVRNICLSKGWNDPMKRTLTSFLAGQWAGPVTAFQMNSSSSMSSF